MGIQESVCVVWVDASRSCIIINHCQMPGSGLKLLPTLMLPALELMQSILRILSSICGHDTQLRMIYLVKITAI